MLLFTLAPLQTARLMLRRLVTEMRIDAPNSGIALTVDVNGVGGASALHYLIGDGLIQEGDVCGMKDNPYSLIIAIAEKGQSALVLEAAESVGVSGGTLNGGVFGGGGRSTANVTGNVTIAISGNANVGWVCGTGNSPIGGNSTITISGGTIDDDICGGGYLMNGTIGGSSSVTISGGTIKRNVIGGGYSGGNTVGGSSSVTISV